MPHFTNVVDGATIKTQQYTLRRKKGFIMNHDITNEVLAEFSTAFSSNPVNRIAMNAVTSAGLLAASKNPIAQRESRHSYSISLEQG